MLLGLQADKGQDCHYDNDKADKVNNLVHFSLLWLNLIIKMEETGSSSFILLGPASRQRIKTLILARIFYKPLSQKEKILDRPESFYSGAGTGWISISTAVTKAFALRTTSGIENPGSLFIAGLGK